MSGGEEVVSIGELIERIEVAEEHVSISKTSVPEEPRKRLTECPTRRSITLLYLTAAG